MKYYLQLLIQTQINYDYYETRVMVIDPEKIEKDTVKWIEEYGNDSNYILFEGDEFDDIRKKIKYIPFNVKSDAVLFDSFTRNKLFTLENSTIKVYRFLREEMTSL